MATNKIIVGSKDCPISKVLKLLKSSTSFYKFQSQWRYVAVDLETNRELVQRLQQKIILDTFGLIDVVSELLEEWVAVKSENASLQELAKILEENGLKDCADTLVNGIIEAQQKQTLVSVKKGKTKNYSRPPTGLLEFRNGTSKLCILHTLDNKITTNKIIENMENYSIHDFDEFLEILSSQETRDTATIDIVKDYSMKKLQKLIKLCDNGINKAVLITCEGEALITEILNKLAPSKNSLKVIRDKMPWDDLTIRFQTKITKTLEEKYKIDFGDEEFNGQLLVDLINGKEVQIFRKTLPQQLSYYIDRTVSTRRYVSTKIFDQNSTDVFLFTGISKHELSILTGERLTDTSGIQLGHPKLTVNFMIMDLSDHFQNIAKKCSCNVHLINYENGKLKWVKTSGSLKTIQQNVEKTEEKLHEEEFVRTVNSNLSQAVIISDSPGMGKSVLLGKIGQRIKEDHPTRLVVFGVLTEFIQNFIGVETDKLTTTIKLVLENLLCENVIGERVLGNELNSDEISIELLLDGLDELDSAYLILSYEVLKAISSIPAVRIWITSRPHLMEELETKLNTLGHNISPFEEEHQIQFLTSYWSRDKQPNQNKLETFATECLKNLQAKMDTKDHEVAGIPLQCLLLGKVFEKEALSYANSEDVLLQPNLNFIASITDLYKLFVKQKIDIYSSVHAPEKNSDSTNCLMKMHVKLSLKLLFPKFVDKLNEFLEPSEDWNELLNVGILESSGPGVSPRFLHRTFAEYFVAWFVVDKLLSENGWNEVLTDFLFKEVLQCKRDRESFYSSLCYDTYISESLLGPSGNDNESVLFIFANPVISYFINELIADVQIVSTQTVDSINKKYANSASTGIKVYESCARHNFIHILKYLEEMKVFEKHSGLLFSKKCVLLSIDYAEVELVKIVLEQAEQHNEWDVNPNNKLEVLLRAINRSRFNMVEFFINHKGFRQILNDFKGRRLDDGFLGSCVQYTTHRSASEIEERIEVLRLLEKIDHELLEDIDSIGYTPLMLQGVHVKLMLELFKLGANIFAKNKNMNTFWHYPYSTTCKDYHTLLASLSIEKVQDLVHLRNLNGMTPLIHIVEKFEPLPQTLEIFQSAGANFNTVDGNGMSVLANAVKWHRSNATLKNLIKYGSNPSWTLEDGTTLLHIAAQSPANVKAAKFLIEENLIDKNGFDGNGDTPLHCWLKHADHTRFFEITEFLLSLNANPNLVDKIGDTPFYTLLKRPSFEFQTAQLLKSKTNVKWRSTPAHCWMVIICQHETENLENELSSFQRECTKFGVDLNLRYQDEEGNSLLHLAANYSYDKALKFLGEKKVIDVNIQNNQQQTVLHIAAKRMRVECVMDTIKYLVECGADVYRRDEEGLTFIHNYILYICDANELSFNIMMLKMVSYLFEKGCSFLFETMGGEKGCTPLHFAFDRENSKSIRMETLTVLHKCGINFNVVDKNGDSILRYAIKEDWEESDGIYYEFISKLVQLGADWKILNNQNSSVIHKSAKIGSFKLLKFFLELGELDANAKDVDGNTPLHYAVQRKSPWKITDVCKLLIEKGGDVNVKNKEGRTPLEIAIMKDFVFGFKDELLQTLRHHKA